MRTHFVVVAPVSSQQMAKVPLAEHTTWSRHSRRIEPIALSQYPFCHGDRGAVGRSRMPIARRRRMKSGVKGQSKTCGFPIIVGSATALAAKDKFAIGEIDFFAVKGRGET